jgi:hypothetical protein
MTETATGGHDGRPPDRLPLRARLALVVGGVLLLAAFTVEALGITGNVHAWLPPLSAYLEPTFGEPAALLTCLATAAVVVGYGTSAASRLSWGRLLLSSWLTGVVWGFAVALLRGWNTGIVAVLDHPDEYLMDVDRVDGVTSLLSIYTDNILLVPDRYNFVTHNSGHPPLPLLSYAGLDAIGLGGPAWAGVLTALVGSTAVVAVLVTLRRLGDERQARRAAPFLALSPLAIWVFVSADGAFMAVAAWGLAVLACAAVEQRPRRARALGAVAGVVLGGCLFLSYGLLLLGPLALAVLWVAGSWRPLVPAALAALAVVALFALGASGGWRASSSWFSGTTRASPTADRSRTGSGPTSRRRLRCWSGCRGRHRHGGELTAEGTRNPCRVVAGGGCAGGDRHGRPQRAVKVGDRTDLAPFHGLAGAVGHPASDADTPDLGRVAGRVDARHLPDPAYDLVSSRRKLRHG